MPEELLDLEQGGNLVLQQGGKLQLQQSVLANYLLLQKGGHLTLDQGGSLELEAGAFIGLTIWQALAVLANNGLVPNPVIIYAYSVSVPENYVISQTPAAGTPISSGQSVQLTVSLGQPNAVVTATVPNVAGMLVLDAERALVAANCGVSQVIWEISASVAVATVISQTPAPGGPVGEWTQVSLTVSSGPPVTYPNTTPVPVPPLTT